MEVVKNKPENWTKYIGWETEAIRSATAKQHNLGNFPTKEHLENMMHIVEKVFIPLREHLKSPIHVSSFYRSKAVNEKVPGASKTSQHLVGEAMDLCKYAHSKFTNKDIFEYIKNHLEFDQLIWEYGDTKEPKWVHVSLKRTGKNRKQILYILK